MNVKDRPRLGRGLKSLISHPVAVSSPLPINHDPSGPPQSPTNGTGDVPRVERLADVALDQIDPNPYQPRSAIDPATLAELAASIKSSGILQPVILRPFSGRYQLVAGHRRVEAAKLAGLQAIPALLRHDSTEEQQAEWALIENIQRQDLNPIERAQAYRSYINKFDLTHAQAAERLGEDRVTISNFLRLLDLHQAIQIMIARGQLTAGHAKVLAGIADPVRQEALANRAIAENLSVRKLEQLLGTAGEGGGSDGLDGQERTTEVSAHARAIMAKSPHVLELEQELSRKLGTKLRIFPSRKKNTGKIVIQYYSLDEFDRIVEKFN